MTACKYVAFVRAIMIGREGLHRAVLLESFKEAGAANAVSHLTTGNVSFDAESSRVGDQITAVKRGVEAVVGRPTEIFVRTLEELIAMRDADPFQSPPLRDDYDCTVAFFADRVPDGVQLPIWSPTRDVVVFAAHERELFTVSARQNGLSRGSGGLIERLTGQRVTSRSWSTIQRVLARLE
jgi:uncharacterized protein (DUF1697 family)